MKLMTIFFNMLIPFILVDAQSASSLKFTVKGVEFEMVRVKAGTFIMGSDLEEAPKISKPAHQVSLTKDYYIGKFEVTEALWEAVMGIIDQDKDKNGKNHPIGCVSWDEITKEDGFIARLNSILSSELKGWHFSLPTEAQWEYAAKGGDKSKGYAYSGSDNLDDVAWYMFNGGYQIQEVGKKAPNELGIYDMSGNVWEWCYDGANTYTSSPKIDPMGSLADERRIYKGGCVFAEDCPPFGRMRQLPTFDGQTNGLRLALVY